MLMSNARLHCYFTLENINIFEYTEFIYLEFGVVVWLFMHGIYNDGLLADFNVWKDHLKLVLKNILHSSNTVLPSQTIIKRPDDVNYMDSHI